MLAISTDPLERLIEGRKRYPELPCRLASDAEYKAIRALDLIHRTARKLLAVPANVLVDKDGIVKWAHYATIVADRPDPNDVLEKVRQLA